MKNLFAHSAHTVPRKRWTFIACTAVLVFGGGLVARPAHALPVPTLPTFDATLYVGKDGNDTTGTGAINKRYRTITKAVGQVEGVLQKPTIVIVGPGNYAESVDLPYNTTVWLRSEEGPDMTTLSGGPGGFSSTITMSTDAGQPVLSGVQGFTISGNNVSSPSCGFCSGAISVSGSYQDQFFILDNRIIGNASQSSSFYVAGAIFVDYDITPFIVGNEIIGNGSKGSVGGIFCFGNSGVISNNIIAENVGTLAGGLQVLSSGEYAVSGNTIANNVVQNPLATGGAYLGEAFVGKSGSLSAGLAQVTIDFNNNIVAGNGAGWGLEADGYATVYWDHNLFYDNGGSSDRDYDQANLQLITTGNIFGEDPLFANPPNGDFHITCPSPARDAGNNDLIPPDFLSHDHDIDGPPQGRIGPHPPGILPTVDIGADEFWDTDKIAEFSTPDTVGCAPLTVHFTNESECIDQEWRWFSSDSPGTMISADKNPTHVYTQPGLYTVQLDAVGDLDTATVIKTAYIRVLPPQIINFDGDNLSGCGSVTTLFTATASADVDSFQWVFGDGDSTYADSATIAHTYSSVGLFTVILRVFNVCGVIEIIKPDYITTLSGAEAAITSDFNPEAPPCFPAEVTFGYESSQTLTEFLWLFGDGRSSTDANPIHQYDEAGTFTVSLSATSECGDVFVEETDFITILGAPDVTLNATPASGCEGELLVQFSAVITGDADSSRWFFDDNFSALGPDALHTYTDAGEYNPFCVVYHPCGVDSFDLAVPIVVSPAPLADFSASPTTAYETETVVFTDLSQNAVSYQWTFGDGGTSTLPSPQHAYAPGVYTVSLQITNGCGPDTETKNNYIHVGSFEVSCDSSGTSGNDILYTVDVDSLVIGYDHPVVLSATLLGAPARGSVDFAFDTPSGTPPFSTILRATPKGGLSSGTYTIRITANDALRMSKTTQCSLKYNAQQLINFFATPFDFGDVIVNTSSVHDVVIQNTAAPGSEATLEIDPPAVTGTAFSVDGTGRVLQPGETLTWQVTFTPPNVLPYTGTLHIESDDPVAPSIDIDLMGDGIPVPDTEPPCVDFTNPAAGTEIAIDSVIRITFTEGMVAQSGIVEVYSAIRRGLIAGTTVWESARRVRFTPGDFLPPDDDLTITVRATVADTAGNTLDGDCNSTAEGSPADDFTFECTTGPGVLPGDTDNDGFVNEGDIIPIGRFWHLTGPKRTNPQSGFTLQPATAWNPRAATYANADGDSRVDSLDICPVIEFFGEPNGLPRVAVEAWLNEAQGWSEDIVSAMLSALDICDNQSAGSAAVRQFLISLQSSNDPVPSRYALHQNYPNPFNPTTIIAYTLKQDTRVSIEVFDIQGHRVRVLEDRFQTAGRHNVIWDGRDADGGAVASGIYFYRMTTPDFHFSRKMVLVR